jgi:tape measure domain-containing protein
MATKIASFAAELELKIKNLGSLKDFEKRFDNLPKKFKKLEVAQKELNRSVSRGHADMIKQAAERAKVIKREIYLKKIRDKNNKLGTGYRKSAGFKRLSQVESGIKSSTAYRSAQNAVGQSAAARAAKVRRGLEERFDLSSHADRTRALNNADKLAERNRKAATTLARMQANAAAREASAAQRTAAIREAGARRSAAIIEAGERRAAAVRESANRRMGGGRGGGGSFGRAGMGGALGAAGSGIAGFLPGFGAAFTLNKVNSINQEMQGQGMAMQAVTGSVAAGAEQQAFVKNLSNTVGLDYRNITPNYTKMLASGLGSGMQTGDVQTIFQGTAEYGRVMGLNAEAMQGSMRALEQMMNKGQVMSEELKGQFAERMPGAVSMMAEAAGFGTGDDAPAKLFKAMEAGEVKSKDVLVKLANIMATKARNGGALAKAMESTAAQQQRFNNDVTDMIVIMSDAGADKGFGSMFKSFSKFLTDNKGLVETFGKAIERLSVILDGMLEGLSIFGNMLADLTKNLGLSEVALMGLVTVALMLATPFGTIILGLSAILLLVEDIAVYNRGGKSMIGLLVEAIPEDTRQGFSDFGDAVMGLKDEFAGLFEVLGKHAKDFDAGGAIYTAFNAFLTVITALATKMTDVVRLGAAVLSGDTAKMSEAYQIAAGNVINNVVGVADTLLPGLSLDSGVIGGGMTAAERKQDSLNKIADSNARKDAKKQGSDFASSFGDIIINFQGDLSQINEGTGRQIGRTFVQEVLLANQNMTGANQE